VHGPVEWACASCGQVLSEDPATWRARRSRAYGEWLKCLFEEARRNRDNAVAAPKVSQAKAVEDDAWSGIVGGFAAGEGFDEFEAGCDDYDRWRRDALSPDLEKAEQHFRRAAEQGETLAYPYLGEIALASNRQVEATRWFRQADADHSTSSQLGRLKQAVLAGAEAGDADAQCEVAEWFAEGHGVPRDSTKATAWLQRAADQGFPPALYRLAVLYENGDGVVRDYPTALSLHERAAQAGQPDAQYRLAQLYRDGGLLPKDLTKAMEWLHLAASRDHLQAIVDLAEIMVEGEDFAGAAPLLERAAVRGDPRAQCLLSWRYRGGEGVTRDEQQSLYWLRRSARQGDIGAACDLGQRYRDGEGVERDEAPGPPGTGKTTVARLIGKLLGALGILSSGHLKEVDRAGLVGRYVGETAQKVEDVVQEALGGVLFIDEAYSLSRSDNPSDYGHEAIDALVKRMEDHRSNLVVIVAGYGDEMDTFLQSNTGLESRFPWRFRFPHYSAAELLQVLQHLADKDGMRLDTAFLRAVHTTLAKHAGRDRSFGNGRFVRTLYEKARFQQAQRLLRQTRPTNDQLQTLLPDDLPLDRG